MGAIITTVSLLVALISGIEKEEEIRQKSAQNDEQLSAHTIPLDPETPTD